MLQLPESNRHGTPLRCLLCLVLMGFLVACGGGEEESKVVGQPPETETQRAEDSEPEAAAATTDLRTFAYDGDDGSYIVVHLHADTDEATIFLPRQTVRLPRVSSASGAKFSNHTITFWTKGDEATLELQDGKVIRCTENRRRSRIEDSKLRGNDYWATGNEPGWTLEIGPETTVLLTDYGETRYEFRTPEPRVDSEGRRTTYSTRDDGVQIVIRILGEPCHDSMSGEAFESTVEIQVGEQRLMGCGLALH